MWHTKFIIFLVVVLKIVKCDLDLTHSIITDTALRLYNITLCCPGDNLIDPLVKHCRNNTPYELDCPDGMYVINPKDAAEGQIIIQSDRHLYQEIYEDVLPPSEYCVTNYKNDSMQQPAQLVFICYDGESTDWYYTVFIIRATLAFISVFFLLLTLYIYSILPDLRETQDKLTICAIICSTIFLFLLALLQVTPGIIPTGLCVVIAFIILFFVLAHFSWLNMVMANVWKITVFRRWKILEKHWILLTHVYAWTIPTIIIVLALVGHHSHRIEGPGFGTVSCWFGNRDVAYNFLYIPMSIMLAINLVFFVWSAYALFKQGPDMSMDRKRALSYRCKLYVVLFGLSGLTWIFEILSHHFQNTNEFQWYWFMTDVLNTLYGVFTFIILTVWRKRVRKSLAGKRILCVTLPKSWSSGEAPEEETLQYEDADNRNEVQVVETPKQNE